MNSIIGYIFSAIGLVTLLASDKIITFLSKYAQVKLPFVVIAGVALILIGIFILMNPSKKSNHIGQAAEEVPIYSGEGKNRRIVGYRKG